MSDQNIQLPNSLGQIETQYFTFADQSRPFFLQNKSQLAPVTLAYETYGKLNKEKSNAVLVLHALSGDAHAAGYHKNKQKPGWWDLFIGPGKAFDTDKYFIICSNVIGGCKGSTGPSSVNPQTQKPYGLSFPFVTVKDMVQAQKHLIDHLGIEKLLAVAGGSMGGMQALKWSLSFPEKVHSSIVIAANTRHTAQQIALNEVARQAIMADPDWQNGNYYGQSIPARGLAVARMIGHITYMSDRSMQEKFGRQLIEKQRSGFDFTTDFQVESYLKYRGDSFVQRFDANSYLYISKALDYFDLAKGGPLADVFSAARCSYLVISFTSDWLYPSYQVQEMVKAMKINDLDVSYCEVSSSYGHDAFLVENEGQTQLISHFLNNMQSQF